MQLSLRFLCVLIAGPSLPPSQLEVNALSSQSLLLTWSTPEKAALNGILHGFQINITQEQNDQGSALPRTKTAFVASHLPNSFTATALLPDTSYLVSVAAVTGGGAGPAAVKLAATQEDGERKMICFCFVFK